MKTKIAINGFGRIGRNAFKIAFQRSDLEIVAINDLTDTKTLAHLLKHDSNYGTYQNDVDFDEENIIVSGKKIKVLAEKDPTALPWKDMDVDVVIEATGLFTKHEDLKKHLAAGAKKVVLSAPEKDDTDHDTFVIGVNEQDMKPEHEIFSNASCTTNCITPIMAILENEFGIEKAMMTTVHSYTASQRLQDAPAKDLREARSAAANIVPTTTGASIAAAKAFPPLEGIFGGMSVRVPTPVVSLSDFAIVTKKKVTVEEVNEVFKKAAKEPYYQGILDATEEELVSTDYIGNSHSAVVDLKLTAVIGGNLLKVVAWYDNEWGYSNRLVELTADIGKLVHGGSAPDGANAKEQSKELGSETEKPEEDHTVEKEPETTEPLGVSSENSQEHQSPEELLKEPDEPLLEAPDSDSLAHKEPDQSQHESLEQTPAKPQPGTKTEEAPYIISMPPSAAKTEGDQPGAPPTDDNIHRF
jgi:glyceraldehyde 3-phosphate dehydrogenase